MHLIGLINACFDDRLANLGNRCLMLKRPQSTNRSGIGISEKEETLSLQAISDSPSNGKLTYRRILPEFSQSTNRKANNSISSREVNSKHNFIWVVSPPISRGSMKLGV